MQAWVQRQAGKPSEVLHMRDGWAEPVPTKRTPIIVKVHAASLNPDGYVLMRFFPNFFLRKPRIPEIDFSGTIDESSNLEGTSYDVGEPVFGHILPSHYVLHGQGTLAEFVAVSPNWIARKPVELSHAEAAALPTVGISAHKLAKHVCKGDKVFVNGGSGGVGTILLQMLKNDIGACVVTTASEKSRAMVQEHLKPDVIIDYQQVGDLGKHLAKHYGRIFDVVIDLIGDTSLYRSSPTFVKPDGVYLAFGGGLSSTSFPHFLHWLAATLLVGYWPRVLGGVGTRFRFVAVASEGDTVEGLHAILRPIEKGTLRPVLDSSYSFAEVPKAYDKMISRRADGKVVVQLVQEDPSTG